MTNQENVVKLPTKSKIMKTFELDCIYGSYVDYPKSNYYSMIKSIQNTNLQKTIRELYRYDAENQEVKKVIQYFFRIFGKRKREKSF